MERTCTACGYLGDEDNFARDPRSKSGIKNVCRPCQSKRVAASKARNPQTGRAWRMKSLFGLADGEYDAILTRQGGGCAICGKPAPSNGRRFPVDHDHNCCPGKTSCGKCVRGILCTFCNVRVCWFEIHRERAAAYLAAHN